MPYEGLVQPSWFGWIFAVSEEEGKDAEGRRTGSGRDAKGWCAGLSITTVILGCDMERTGRLLPESL